MIVDIKLAEVSKNGKVAKLYLIRCDTCNKEKWYRGKECNNGIRRYCSRPCINKGRPHTDKWKSQMSARNMGDKNPFSGRKHSVETRLRMRESHVTAPSMWDIKKQTLSAEEYDIWYSKYCLNRSGQNNHFFGKRHSASTRKHLSEVRAKLISEGKIDLGPSHYGIKGYYFSAKMNERFRHDSLAERVRMMILDADDDVVGWTKRHAIRIGYKFDGYCKMYIPDFLIEKEDGYMLEEVKGYENLRKKEAKFDALRNYCRNNGLMSNILTYSDIDKLCKHWFGKSMYIARKEYKNGKM